MSVLTDARRSPAISARLSVMMLLHFIAFGAWFTTLGLVLATNGMADVIGIAYSSASLGAIVAPLLFGSLVDRFVGGKAVLIASHAICAVLMILLMQAVNSGSSGLALLLVFVYMFVYMPNMAVVNTIALNSLGAKNSRFPYIRVFGTLGFVVAGLLVGALGLSASPLIFLVSAIASVVMAIYSLTLPSTPPAGRGKRFSIGDVVGARAFTLFRSRNFVVFAICALLIGMPLALYTAYASPFLAALGVENVAGVLAIGPLSEIIFIVTIPLVLRFLGMKWALFAGMAMWAVRFALFILATDAGITPAIIAVALHGICNDFFLVLGAMYVSRICPPAIAAQGQSLFLLLFSGVGAFIGSLIGNALFNGLVGADGAVAAGWNSLWWVGVAVSAVAALLWAVLFSSRKYQSETAAVAPMTDKVAA